MQEEENHDSPDSLQRKGSGLRQAHVSDQMYFSAGKWVTDSDWTSPELIKLFYFRLDEYPYQDLLIECHLQT